MKNRMQRGAAAEQVQLLLEEHSDDARTPASASRMKHGSWRVRFARMQLHYKVLVLLGVAALVYTSGLLLVALGRFLLSSNSVASYDYSPLSSPHRLEDGSLVFRIAVVTDLDKESIIKSEDGKKAKWQSFFKKGKLIVSPDAESVSVDWGKGTPDISLKTELANGGRAMELSDLVVFNHRLLTVDDRTGVIYEISNEKDVVPWLILGDGPGNVTKPFKGEWMTVKDEHLFVGGLGKEWTDEEGHYINDHPMWVKRVDRFGRVEHFPWVDNYKLVRGSMGIEWPGYMVHEAVQWSDVHQKWFFLPRRVSREEYNEAADEGRGSNVLLSLDDSFSSPALVTRIGTQNAPSFRGFAAFQFVPGTKDSIIVALKSEERDGKPVATYITAFDIEGNILMPDQPLTGSYKFEGLAFI